MKTEREALEDVLTAHFAVARLSGLAVGYFYGAAIPSLFLWVHAWHPLSQVITWPCSLAWAGCVWLSVALTIAAWRNGRRLMSSLPAAERVVHIELPTSDAVPEASFLFVLLAVVASALLWAHALWPLLVSPPVLRIGQSAWVLSLAAALGNRCIERLS